MQNKKIAIIGAGIAGLSAAVELSKDFDSITIFEKKSYNGGRVFSFYDKGFDSYLDNGQHILIGAYKNFLNILNEIDATNLIKWQENLKIEFLNNKNQKFLLNSKLPGSLGLLYALLNLNSLKFKEKINIINFILKIKFNKINSKGKSAYEILFNERQSAGTIQNFWEPFILATLNSDLKIVSGNLFIMTLQKSLMGSSNDSKLIFPRTQLSNIIMAYEEYLRNKNVKIINNAKIQKLEINNNKIQGLHCGDKFMEFDAVISTIPPDKLKNLYQNSKIQTNNFYEFEFSPIYSAYFLLDKNFDFDFYGLINSDVHWVFNKYESLSNQRAIISCTISSANNLKNFSQEELKLKLWHELCKFIPDLNNAKLLKSKIIKESNATPIISVESEKFRPDSITEFENFFLAGDWTDTGLPCTIESACLSGLVVRKICYDYLKK